MTLKEVNTEHLRKHMNQHGRLTVINSVGYRHILFGFIRNVCDDYVLWEDNETGERFTLPLPATFKKIKLK
jgi:hypothetical protein